MTEYTQFLLATEYNPSPNSKGKAIVDKMDEALAGTESPFNKDVETLRLNYGLKKGTTIELTLKQALDLIPRERKRSDAYRQLQKHLQGVYGVTLTITTIKRK